MKRLPGNWWTISAAIACLATAILCLGLPIFFGPLRPWWVRLLLLLLITMAWGLLAWRRHVSARAGSDAIAAELTRSGDGEGRELAARMREALSTLRNTAGGRHSDYLYSRPWYVIIGPPGAGKTTALVNSGLHFPYASAALKGVSGTRNLEFMFADEAVLVDTAGRYTSQDSDASADAKGWAAFLALLRRHRPLQPINGVIVAIGIDELAKGDRAAIDRHAMAVRHRLAELRQTLQIAVPVYVLLTKADLLAGFVEFFDDLDVERRRAVLGQTLRFSAAGPRGDALAGAFDDMANAIQARQAIRLSSENDVQRRALILGFPSQIASLRARLIHFLDGAFLADPERAGLLRGFYLTSGLQDGTPLDRIVSGMAQVYDLPRIAAAGSGRAYFLNRLLSDVIFAEAGLVQTDAPAQRRQQMQLRGAIAAIAAFSALLLLLWGISFARNRALQAAMLDRAAAAARLQHDAGIDLADVHDGDPPLDRAIGLLRAIDKLPRGHAAQQSGDAPLTMRFGLYRRGLARQADQAYRESLRRILLPRILLEIEADLKKNITHPRAVYEPLKVYLMLGGQEPMDIDAVRNWVRAYWANEAYPGAAAEPVRKELGRHLDMLLADPDIAGVWPNRKAPLDGMLIAKARAAVRRMSAAGEACGKDGIGLSRCPASL